MTLFQFYKRAIGNHKFKIFGMVLGDAIQAAFMLMIPFALKSIVDALETYDSSVHGAGWDYMREPFMWFVIIIIGQEFGSRLSGMCLAFTAGQVRLKPRSEMIDYLQTHSMNFYQNMHSGSLGSRINEACTGFGFSIWTFIFDLWPVIIKVLTGIILLFLSLPFLAWVLMIWFVVYASIMIIFGLKIFYWSTQTSKARSLITGKVVDMATNIYSVKSFSNEKYEKEILHEAGIKEKFTINKFQKFREASGILNSFMFFGILFFMGYYCIDGYLNNQLTLGDISFIISMVLVLITNMQSMIWGFTHLLEHIGQTREGVDIIYKARTVIDKPDATYLNVNQASIKFDNTRFSYPEKPDHNVFENLNLEIPAGQKIGLVGTSGAGKSTLMNLILRFFDLSDGQILIDGQNIAEVTQQSLRNHIAVIPQDTSLFHRSLMDNIRYGRLEASDAEVFEAAKKAHAHGFISDLPDSYATLVGERGVKLSGGQRQRIAIARAILKDAPILILDEATSALDSESEKAIQDSLKTLMEGKTVIAIAHRLSTIAHLDRIIVMDNGKIVEDGTHEELLAKDRHYAMLWSMQSGGFLKSS
jgi:ATP-binding cassette subfamily B protein